MANDKGPVPIIVGVGDVKNRSLAPEAAVEPMRLMLQAIHKAIEDTGLPTSATQSLQFEIDSIDVVRSWTWPYEDLPDLLASNLGAAVKHKFYSDHGGNQPGKLIDDTARRISQGEVKIAVVTGGEALASLGACFKAKKMPPGWTKPYGEIGSSSPLSPVRYNANIGARYSVGLPVHVYPMYENAFRAYRGQSLQANNEESAKLYAEFARIAASNPNSWNHGKPAATEQDIGTVSKANRMISSPYPLLMNAFNSVNLAGACLLTSTDYAKKLGIPSEKWIYLLGGAGTRDSMDFWERPSFHDSPSISRSLDAALSVSGLTKENVDLFDFYSCFPIVPKLACEHLGLPLLNCPRPISLLGGLTSFGGAGNNYSMHAFTEMVRQLRQGSGRNGLVLANGGVATYQHVVCLSSQPRKDGSSYPAVNPLPVAIEDVPVPGFTETASGEATIETYTVEFKRDGNPSKAHIVGRLNDNGARFISNDGDNTTLQLLTSETQEPIGRHGHVTHEETSGRNLFFLSRKPTRL